MSTPAVSAYETGRPVKFYLRMEIANPQQFWNFDHDANAYVEHQMDLFSDRCADLLTEHLPEGSVFIHDRETRWHYSTHMIGTRKANYRAILQCCYYTFEEVVDQVDALAPGDTIPLDIGNCQHVVEIVWPNRPRKQEYFMDVWDDQDSTPILDASVAKTALQTAGFKPTDVMHATSQKHAKMFRTGWIATLEVETLQKIEPIKFMFGDRALNIRLTRRTALNRHQPHTTGLQALANAKAEYAEAKSTSKDYRQALMLQQAQYPLTPTKRSGTVLFSNVSQRDMRRQRPTTPDRRQVALPKSPSEFPPMERGHSPTIQEEAPPTREETAFIQENLEIMTDEDM